MKIIWRLIYVGLLISAPYAGFKSLGPEETAKTNPDWVFIAVTFIGCLIFPLMALGFSRAHGVNEFRKPTFDRNVLRWWTDPLQPLRFCVYASILTCAGAAVAFPNTDSIGKLTLYWYIAIAVGLVLGERLAYMVFQKRIVELTSPCDVATRAVPEK